MFWNPCGISHSHAEELGQVPSPKAHSPYLPGGYPIWFP